MRSFKLIFAMRYLLFLIQLLLISLSCTGQENTFEYKLKVIDSCIKNEHFDDAIKYVNNILLVDSNNTDVLWKRAWIYGKQGLYQNALEDKEHIARLEPENAINWCDAAWYALLLNKKKIGLNYAKSAFNLMTSNYKTSLRLAHAYVLNEEDKEAQFYYIMAAEYLPNEIELEAMKSEIDTLVKRKIFPYNKKTAESIKNNFTENYQVYSKNITATNILDSIEQTIYYHDANEYSSILLDLKNRFCINEVTNKYSRYFVLRDFLWHLGNFELSKGNLIKARDFYFYKSLAYSIELKDTIRLVDQLYFIGGKKIRADADVFQNKKNVHIANEYLVAALKYCTISKKIEHKKLIDILIRLSDNFDEIKMYDTALYYAKLSYNEAIKDTSNLEKAITANLIAMQFSKLNLFDSVEYFYTLCKEYIIKEPLIDQYSVDNNFCVMLFNNKNYQLSYKYAKQFIDYYKQYQYKIDISEIYEIGGNALYKLNKLNEAKKWFQSAIDTYKNWLTTHPDNDFNATPSKKRLLSFRRLKQIAFYDKKANNEELFSIAEQSKANIFYSSLTGKNYPTKNISIKELQSNLQEGELAISYNINSDIDCSYILAISKNECKKIPFKHDSIEALMTTFKIDAWKPAINSRYSYFVNESFIHIENDTGSTINAKKLVTLIAIIYWYNFTYISTNTSRSTIQKNSEKSYYKVFQENSTNYLYHLFVSPLEEMLQGKSKIIVLQDQTTNLIPFESLKNSEGIYLGELFSIIYQPSATVNSLMQQRKREVTTNKLLVIGNPDYSNFHPKANDKAYDLSKLGYGQWMDLPGTEKEINAIHHIVSNAEIVTQKNVHESWIKHQSEKGILQNNYDVIHFAVHGLYSPDNYEENALILTDSVNTSDDGFLLFSEISKLKLNAKLVILSACETAQGVPSADIAPNLISAFIMAGAQGVIGTSWKIDDAATALFMSHFYNLVYNKKMSITNALKETRQAFINGVYGEKYKHPYYWAPFKYTGINQ